MLTLTTGCSTDPVLASSLPTKILIFSLLLLILAEVKHLVPLPTGLCLSLLLTRNDGKFTLEFALKFCIRRRKRLVLWKKKKRQGNSDVPPCCRGPPSFWLARNPLDLLLASSSCWKCYFKSFSQEVILHVKFKLMANIHFPCRNDHANRASFPPQPTPWAVSVPLQAL